MPHRFFDTKTGSELTEGIEFTDDNRITCNGFNIGRYDSIGVVMQPGYHYMPHVEVARVESITEMLETAPPVIETSIETGEVEVPAPEGET